MGNSSSAATGATPQQRLDAIADMQEQVDVTDLSVARLLADMDAGTTTDAVALAATGDEDLEPTRSINTRRVGATTPADITEPTTGKPPAAPGELPSTRVPPRQQPAADERPVSAQPGVRSSSPLAASTLSAVLPAHGSQTGEWEASSTGGSEDSEQWEAFIEDDAATRIQAVFRGCQVRDPVRWRCAELQRAMTLELRQDYARTGSPALTAVNPARLGQLQDAAAAADLRARIAATDERIAKQEQLNETENLRRLLAEREAKFERLQEKHEQLMRDAEAFKEEAEASRLRQVEKSFQHTLSVLEPEPELELELEPEPEPEALLLPVESPRGALALAPEPELEPEQEPDVPVMRQARRIQRVGMARTREPRSSAHAESAREQREQRHLAEQQRQLAVDRKRRECQNRVHEQRAAAVLRKRAAAVALEERAKQQQLDQQQQKFEAAQRFAANEAIRKRRLVEQRDQERSQRANRRQSQLARLALLKTAQEERQQQREEALIQHRKRAAEGKERQEIDLLERKMKDMANLVVQKKRYSQDVRAGRASAGLQTRPRTVTPDGRAVSPGSRSSATVINQPSVAFGSGSTRLSRGGKSPPKPARGGRQSKLPPGKQTVLRSASKQQSLQLRQDAQHRASMLHQMNLRRDKMAQAARVRGQRRAKQAVDLVDGISPPAAASANLPLVFAQPVSPGSRGPQQYLVNQSPYLGLPYLAHDLYPTMSEITQQ